MKRIFSALVSISVATAALIAAPAAAQAAAPTYMCDYSGSQSTQYYGSPGVNAWMVQPMGYAYWPVDCYVAGTYGSPDAVRAIQRALNVCNGARLVVDGVYGTNTANAVRAVQSANGITVDGKYGPQTRDYMAWLTTTTAGYQSCWSRF